MSRARTANRTRIPFLVGCGLLLPLSGIAAWSDSASTKVAVPPTITVRRLRGTVAIRLPGGKAFSTLTGARQIGAGSEIDTPNGAVAISASSGQEGEFYQGRFLVNVPAVQPPIIELTLSGSSFNRCAKKRYTASTGAAPTPAQPVRRLWGKAKGRFRTRGRYSITSVRGTVWLTEDDCEGTLTRVNQGKVAVLDLVTGRQTTVAEGTSHLIKAPIEYPTDTDGSSPGAITTGSDGNLWFTEPDVGNIGRSTPGGDVIEFTIPIDNLPPDQESPSPRTIVAGPDKNLWFTIYNVPAIGRITPDGTMTEFPVSSGTQGITVGPDKQIWFTETDAKIGRISTSGSLQEYELTLDLPDDAQNITAGADGNLWFTEFLANRIGRITPDGRTSEFDIPTSDSGPDGITAGTDGNVWFTENIAGQIGRVTPDGTITEYPLPSGDAADPTGIAVGPDRKIWFTESAANNLARITTTGTIIEIPLPTPRSLPGGITSGPQQTIWFTEKATGSIGCAGC